MHFLRPLTHYITAMLLGSTLSACAYIIPPSQNEPRNNIVQGEIRKPTNNPASSGRRSDLVPRDMPTSAPVIPVQQAALPPMTNEVQLQNSGRRVPAENAQFQMSSSSYPPINSVPEAPVMRGANSAQSRLSATQAELEMNRSSAITASKTLANDAAAEPSMLSELPKVEGVVPANDPIQVTPAIVQTPPITEPQPQVIPTKIRRLPANEVPRSSITPAVPVAPMTSIAPRIEMSNAVPVASRLPDMPVFAPPIPLSGRMPEPAPRTAAAVKPAPSITATAPPSQSFAVDMSPTITAQPLPSPQFAAQAPNVRAGDFDPLAVADNASIASTPVAAPRATASSTYVSNRYIAPSRYSGLRN